MTSVTWIKVEPVHLDIVGLILGSLTLTAVFAAIALALGSLLGVTFILRRKRHAFDPDSESLSLFSPPPSASGS